MSLVLGKSLKDQRSRGAVAVASDLSSSKRAKILSLPRLTLPVTSFYSPPSLYG